VAAKGSWCQTIKLLCHWPLRHTLSEAPSVFWQDNNRSHLGSPRFDEAACVSNPVESQTLQTFRKQTLSPLAQEAARR